MPCLWVEEQIEVFLSTPSARRATLQVQAPRRGEKNFYPRPPRGGRRDINGAKLPTLLFLSTPSARRATPVTGVTRRRPAYFYPRPPRGGRLRAAIKQLEADIISIHALREEGDADGGIWKLEAKKFLSTPSARRATSPAPGTSCTPRNFYPRPPRGGRPTITAAR